MDNNKVNNLIARLWQTGLYGWEDVVSKVYEATGEELTYDAVRNRYRRMKERGDLPEPKNLQTTPKPDAAIHDYNSISLESTGNVLVIGDIHEPFTHPDYLAFCVEQERKWKCDTVVFIGDVVDAHAMSFFDHDPDGYSAGDESNLAQAKLQKWYDAFPEALICIGNHDDRPMRKIFNAGIPKRFVRSFAEVWGSPLGWQWGLSFEINNVTYEHGVTSGTHAAYNRALKTRKNIVMGHTHTYPGVKWLAQDWFALNVGCGIDESSYAMAYGKQYNGEVVLGCGVVLNEGKLPIFIPMVS